jgi:hypothetical protein
MPEKAEKIHKDLHEGDSRQCGQVPLENKLGVLQPEPICTITQA